MNTPFIQVDRLSKIYGSQAGDGVLAVGSVTLDLQHGEFTSIVGPSGCGKSTFLKMVGGLLPPSSGSITYSGLPAGKTQPTLGMVFQDAILLPWRTIFENVRLPLEVHHAPKKQAAERARHLIELVGLSGFEDRYPHQLSGGMQQRAAIARALITEPQLLLMDEPFGALDAMTRDHMAVELQRIWTATKSTVVFVTHSIAEAVLLSDKILVMTARPSKVRRIMPVDLERPRTLKNTSTPRFLEYVSSVRDDFAIAGEF